MLVSAKSEDHEQNSAIEPHLNWVRDQIQAGRMKKGDVTCSECGAGFRRLELASAPATQGEYRCPTCGDILEKFEGNAFVAYRLTIQPSIRGVRD